jgi:flagellar biosynthetic protein FlhB
MAGDEDDAQKTEEPTAKKLEDAHQKGDVAQSQEVKHWFMIFAATLAVAMFSGSVMMRIRTAILPFLENPHQMVLDPGGVMALARSLGGDLLVALAFPLALFMVAAIAGNMVQHRPVFTAERMKPKLEKLNPWGGLKKKFSAQNLVDFLKSLVKLILVGVIVLWLVWPERGRLAGLVSYDPQALLHLVGALATRMLFGVTVSMGVIAGADYLFQRFQHLKKQRMSKQEIKDEHKQLEGDPQIKARVRQLRTERARQRMMAAVPEADVVITNPTHFAVALKYDSVMMEAPRLIAKGADKVAARIREAAREHDIPLVEDPPLARALYATVELDEEIPPEHYKAVAQVIGYVMRLKQGGRGTP